MLSTLSGSKLFSKPAIRIKAIFLVCLTTLLLSGCGHMGPLYLPQQNHQPSSTNEHHHD